MKCLSCFTDHELVLVQVSHPLNNSKNQMKIEPMSVAPCMSRTSTSLQTLYTNIYS